MQRSGREWQGPDSGAARTTGSDACGANARVRPCVVASGPRLAETSHWVARDRYAVLLAVDSGAGAGAGAGCGALYAVATALDWPGSERPTAFVRIEAVTHPDGTPAHRTRAIRCWADRCLELVEVEERREERTRPK